MLTIVGKSVDKQNNWQLEVLPPSTYYFLVTYLTMPLYPKYVEIT